ncbi:MAG TPA: glycosyltransferase family 4 protein [Anaerolineales bacterium]|jgi:glycosyltransferase involved in cell wall biosynthesis|nr:glycosyltransferase family 4 protein [Anaerolineales bacterium]
MKILCLINNEVKPDDRWLWNYLPSNTDEVDFVVATGAIDRFKKWGKLFTYYPAFMRAGFHAFRKTRKTPYDLVIAWGGQNGFTYAFLRSMFGQKTPPLIILSFNLQGVLSHFLSLARFGMRSVSRVVVFTPSEVEKYRRMLSLPPEAISYCPHGWYDPMRWYVPGETKEAAALAGNGRFVFTSGRSYRDYETLARAVEGTEACVKVSSRPFNIGGVKLPGNMESLGWLDYRVAQDYMYESSFYVVPLQGIDFAGGDSSLLQAMSFGKAVVATRAPSTETYLEHGKTGLLVEPGDIEGMRQAILHLWRNPDEAIRMGKEARQHFEENHTMDKLAQRVYDVALEVYRAQRG